MQWCENCRGPRFQIPAYSIDDIPQICLKCKQERISERFLEENFAKLRGALREWILGPLIQRDPRVPLPARWIHVSSRFDQVIAVLEEKEATLSSEWQVALRGYRAIRRRPVADLGAPSSTDDTTVSAQLLDVAKLHAFIEEGKALDAKPTHPAETPSAPANPRKRWGIFSKPSDQRD